MIVRLHEEGKVVTFDSETIFKVEIMSEHTQLHVQNAAQWTSLNADADEMIEVQDLNVRK